VVADRIWIPLVGLAAPVGAITYCFSWVGLLNGTEMFPNPWAAILGLAATGLVARRVEGGDPRHAVLASIAIGAMALVRPTEAVALAGAVAIWILVFRRAWWRLLAGLGAGLAFGWLPSIVETSIRFGGPMRAFEAGASAGQVDARSGSSRTAGPPRRHRWTGP
jgi:4-amino-4-deoxy-L-arabinose transferase-like glycosyltransferase